MKVVVCSLAQFAIVLSCFSQSLPRMQVGAGTGFSYNALKNELISPYAQTGTSAPLHVIFRVNTDRSRHFVYVNYISLNLTSTSRGLGTQDTWGGIQYAYHRKIGAIGNANRIYAGLLLDAKGSKRTNNLDGAQISGSHTGEFITSLSPSLYFERSFGDDMIGLQCWSALLNYANQSGYALSYPEHNDLLGPRTYREFGARIFYNKFLTKRFAARLDYQFLYYKISKYETVSSLSDQVVVSLLYNIYAK